LENFLPPRKREKCSVSPKLPQPNMHLLLASFDRPTLSLSFFSSHVTLYQIKQAFEERHGVPASELRVSLHGRCLSDEAIITEEQALSLPPLRVGLRLNGGKGGFGSLLRGGNTKVGQKKVKISFCSQKNSRFQIIHLTSSQFLHIRPPTLMHVVT